MLVKVALSVFLGPEHTRFPLRSLRRGAEQAQNKKRGTTRGTNVEQNRGIVGLSVCQLSRVSYCGSALLVPPQVTPLLYLSLQRPTFIPACQCPPTSTLLVVSRTGEWNFLCPAKPSATR